MRADDDAEMPGEGATTSPFKSEVSPEARELRRLLSRCSLYLVGPTGNGKTVVGRYLARALGFRFLHTDQLIEAVAKKPVAQVIADEGEAAFRNLESKVLEQVSPFVACCVATGGGIVKRKENWGKLHNGVIVYVDTPVDVLRDRLQNETETRPVRHDAVSLRDRTKDIAHERNQLYRQADVSVKCKAGWSDDETGEEAIRVLTSFIKTNPPKLSNMRLSNNIVSS